MPYDSGPALRDVCADCGLSRKLADELGRMLFGSDGGFRLRLHQAESLRASLANRRDHRPNVVVTSGTGSGKTEAFLLPVFARLLREAEGWGASPPLRRWWDPLDPGATPWRAARSSATRPPAVRCIVLYPTNALVEDQMARLRLALTRARAPEDQGPRFFFGRYTGATLGSGQTPASVGENKAARVALELQRMEAECDGLSGVDEALRAQFSDPRSGEMLTRWDMVATPPDVLITNYSMLDVMLMRGLEEPLFAATRSWLAADASHVLTLVVDELHTYRGTQGSEVALVVRNLLMRLGLDADSEQLRCIGTSASLDDERGSEYLEAFFGVSGESFTCIPGNPRATRSFSDRPLRQVFEDAARLDGDKREQEVRQLLTTYDLPMRLADACREQGVLRPTSLAELDERLFDGPPAEPSPIGSPALGVALEAVTLAGEGVESVPFRAHLFARMVQGMWACSDPDCAAVDPAYRHPQRPIGKLYATPRTACECGARVLELLYCFQCGDVSLGGHVAPAVGGQIGAAWYLSPERDASRTAASSQAHRLPHLEYMWYWPGDATGVDGGQWTHKASGATTATTFRFLPAHYEPRLGLLRPASLDTPTGVLLGVTNPPGGNAKVPALPERCPRCGSVESNSKLNVFFQPNVRSPLRGHAAGGNRVAQYSS